MRKISLTLAVLSLGPCCIAPSHQSAVPPATCECCCRQPWRGCFRQACRHSRRNQDSATRWKRRRRWRRHSAGTVCHLCRCLLRGRRDPHSGLQRGSEKREAAGGTRRGPSRPQSDRLVHGTRNPGRRRKGSCRAWHHRCDRHPAEALRHEKLRGGRAADAGHSGCRRSHLVYRYRQRGEDRNRRALAG